MVILVTFKYEEDSIKIEGAPINQRTNGPVNAHLGSASYTNKHI